jgi:uncharacterized protein (TIGR03083 family)
MTKAAVSALQTEVDRALELFRSLTPDEWAAPSGCEGWRVQDVAQHMASTFHSIADPASIPGGTSSDVEENAEVPVQARRDWTPDEVVAEYVEWSAKGVGALSMMQEPGMAEMVIPLGNLGSHPMHILGNAIAFDHYCHLRHDIGAAIPRAAALPRDEPPLRATLEWMLAGIPQMCTEALAGCSQGVNLEFSDVGEPSVYALQPGADGGLWTVSEGAADGLPTATSNVHDFISWGTKRADWRDMGVTVEGAAAGTLDAINVI